MSNPTTASYGTGMDKLIKRETIQAVFLALTTVAVLLCVASGLFLAANSFFIISTKDVIYIVHGIMLFSIVLALEIYYDGQIEVATGATVVVYICSSILVVVSCFVVFCFEVYTCEKREKERKWWLK